MTSYLRNPLVHVWAFLTVITIASYLIGRGHGSEYHLNSAITFGVLLIALIKSRFVIRYFMEVRTSPIWLSRTCDGWLVGVFVMIGAVYYFSL